MSFILDALRKSESERQRGAVPGISQVPLAAPRNRMPVWAVAVITGLGVAVVGLAGAWWKTSRSDLDAPSAQVLAEATVNVPLGIPAPRPIEPPSAAAPAQTPAAVAVQQPPPRPAVRSLSNLPTEPELSARDAVPELSESDEPLVAAAQAPRSAPNANAWRALPSATELAGTGVALPPLRIDLHVFYPDRPKDRFVIINGKRYREGEVTAEGPRVVTIESTGAVLSHQGREFVLSTE